MTAIAKIAICATLILIVIAAFIAMPTIHINSDGIIESGAFQYIRAALYFFPASAACRILSIILGLWVVRIIIAFVKMIWDVLPVA